MLLRVRRPFVFSSHAQMAVLIFPVSLFAQWIEPSGGDPVTVACPNGPTSGIGIDAEDAWIKARQFALIEGDGVFGIGNWGHVPESLAWYCKASAAGNPVAAYDIAEIFREGYAVNSRGPGGQIITKHFLPDLPTAFYWYQLAANRRYTRAMLAVAQYYALGSDILKGSGVPKNITEAKRWLSSAAENGDTEALLMLEHLYSGKDTAPWGKALSLPKDLHVASEFRKKIGEIRGDKDKGGKCIDRENFGIMKDELPDASKGRRILGVSLLAARGSIEVDCILSLSLPQSRENKSDVDQFLDQFSFPGVIHGGAVNSWAYSIYSIPGGKADRIQRQTATEAMIQGVQEIAALMQTLSPPTKPQASTPSRQSPSYPPSSSSAPRGAPATPEANSIKLPSVIHFCAQHCLTFTLENGQFTNYTNLLSQWNEKRVFAVERFRRELVIIHRTDTGSNPLTATYKGRMSDDGNSVSGNGWKITWGAALNTLPKDDKELQERGGWQ